MKIKAIIDDVTNVQNAENIRFSKECVDKAIGNKSLFAVVYENIAIGTATIIYHYPSIEINANIVDCNEQLKTAVLNSRIRFGTLVLKREGNIITECSMRNLIVMPLIDDEVTNIIEYR